MTVATLLRSSPWTSRRRSTLSIMEYCWNIYGDRLGSSAARTRRCIPTSLFVISVFVMAVSLHNQPHRNVASHKDRSWIRSCSCCTMLTYKRSSSGMDCHRISTPTIVRYAAFAGLKIVGTLSQRLVDCIDDVVLRMRSNRLQLNVRKADLL